MKLIIDIPEELKNKIDTANEDNYKFYLWWFETTLYCAIKNGTPLPKGHGRLIDIKQIVTKDECIWNSDGSCTTITTYDIDSTPTIIEADKAEGSR